MEDALALDAFLKMKASGEPRSVCVERLSAQLRSMAINQGSEIDSTYRNESGVSRQMYDLEAAWEERPLSPAISGSKHFYRIVELYKTDRTSFDKLLQDAIKMSDQQKNTINEESFWDWLAKKVTPNQLSEFFQYFGRLNEFVAQTHFFSRTVFNEIVQTSLFQVRNTIRLDSGFQKRFNKYDQKFILNLLDQMGAYIEENKAQIPDNSTNQGPAAPPVQPITTEAMINQDADYGYTEQQGSNLIKEEPYRKFEKADLVNYLKEQRYSNYEIYEISAHIKQLEDGAKQLKAPTKKIFDEDMDKARVSVSWLKYKIKGTYWDKPAIRKTIEILLKYFDYVEQHDVITPVPESESKASALVIETTPAEIPETNDNTSPAEPPVLEPVSKTVQISPDKPDAVDSAISVDQVRSFFIAFMKEQIPWQIDALLVSLVRMEKDAGREKLFSPNIEDGLRSVKLLRYRQKNMESSRTDKKVLDLLEKFFSQQRDCHDWYEMVSHGNINSDHNIPDELLPTESVTSDESIGEEQSPSTIITDPLIETIGFEKIGDVSFSKPISIRYFGKEESISSWRSLFVAACKYLLHDHPIIFERLREDCLNGSRKLGLTDTSHRNQLTVAGFIDEDYYIEVNRSAADLMRNLKVIIDCCGVEYRNVVISFVRSKATDGKNLDPNEDIRIVLEKLSKAYSGRVTPAMVSREIDRKVVPYQVMLILDQADWAKQVEPNLYRYVNVEPVSVDEPAPATKGNPYIENIDADDQPQSPMETDTDLIEPMQEALKTLSAKHPDGVSAALISKYICKKQTAFQVYELLSKADWAQETDYGFIYINPTDSTPADISEQADISDHASEDVSQVIVAVQPKSLVLVEKKDFRSFLTEKGFSLIQQASLGASLQQMEAKSGTVLFDRTKEECLASVEIMRQKLSDPDFYTQEREKALNILSEFLSRDNGSQEEPGDDPEPETPTTEPFPDPNKEWILAQLDARGMTYKDNRWLKGCLWIVGGHAIDGFIEECRQHQYKMYFKPEGCKAFPNKAVWWTTSINYTQVQGDTPPVDQPEPEQTPVQVPNSAQESSGNTSADDRWLQILQESFPDGYILDDIISQIQAAAFWQERYGEACPIDGNDIDVAMKSVGMVLDDRVYAKNDESSKLIDEICAVIKDIFSHYTCVYRSCIYERYRDRLAAQSVYSEEVMTQQLMNAANGSFYSVNKVFALSGQEASSKQDCKKVLRDHGGAMAVNDIAKVLWFIPYDRIYHNLTTDPEAINVDFGTWMLAEHIPLSAKEANEVSTMLNDCFRTQTNVKQSELVPLLQEHLPSIAENLAGLQSAAVFNILYYHLKDRFGFGKAIIAPKGAKTDFNTIFRQFAKDHEQFSLDELAAFAKAQGTVIYWSDTLIGGAARVNRTEFVNRRLIEFDVEGTDRVLRSFCPGDYLAIRDISDAMMMHLPPCGYQWNGYLLQSYVFNVSRSFKLVHNSFSKSGYYGAIVRRSCTEINRYDQLVERVLSDNRNWQTAQDAIALLVQNGLQERQRLDGIDKIIDRIQ